jgi:predicted metal-dependent hydrolase
MDDMKETLSINSTDFEVRRSSRRKRISVGFDTGAETFFIAAPTKLAGTDILRILGPQISRLMDRLTPSAKRALPPHKYEDGEKFYYKGVEYPLKRVHSEKEADLSFREGFFFIGSASGNERKTFKAWYKRALYDEIRKILPEWTRRIKVNPASVNIKTVRSVWGSCSSKGNLTFSTRLALVPPDLLEYVTAHELCHLKHMDHSAAFWEELSGHMPDCKERRKMLRDQEYLYRWW